MAEVNEIDIGYQYANGGKGARNLYLSVSFDTLAEVLRRETAVFPGVDVARVLGVVHAYAKAAGHSEEADLEAWLARVEDECETEDDGE